MASVHKKSFQDYGIIRKCYNNFLQMMEDRGCIVIGLHFLPLSDDHITEELQKPMVLVNRFCLKENPTVEGLSFWTLGVKYDKTFSDSLVWITSSFNVRHLIIVNLSPSNSKYDEITEKYLLQAIDLEVFDYTEFLVGIHGLFYDNKYAKCDQKEKLEVTMAYGQGVKLPLMKVKTRVPRWLGAKKGDVIRVETPSMATPWVEENGKKLTLYDLSYYYVV